METNLSWVLQKGVVRIVGRVVESSEFALGIRHEKAACVASSVDRLK